MKEPGFSYFDYWKLSISEAHPIPLKKQMITTYCPSLYPVSSRIVKLFDKEVMHFLEKKYEKAPLAYFGLNNVTELLQKLASCRNATTFMGDQIKDIPAQYLYFSKNGYCHHIQDLITYLIRSHDTNIDPHDETKTITIWNSPQDKQHVLEHPFLHRIKKENYQKMLKSLQDDASATLPLSVVQRAMDVLGDVIFVSLSTDLQTCTYIVLTAFSDYMSSLHTDQQKKLLAWKNKRGSTLGASLRRKNICNNQYAEQLLEILLYQHFTHYPTVQLPWFISSDKSKAEYRVVTRGGSFFDLWIEHVFQYNAEKEQMIFYCRRFLSLLSTIRSLYQKKEKQTKLRVGLK